jgi:hypothetical protein
MAGLIRVHKFPVWLLLAGAILLVVGFKEIRPGLLSDAPPLDLAGRPALLFFNNEEGCECVLPLYAKADEIIADWPAEQRAQIPVHRLILDNRPDLQRQFEVQRAPMLLLVDGGGQIVWREWGVASNPNVFDLAEMEQHISLLVGSADIN